MLRIQKCQKFHFQTSGSDSCSWFSVTASTSSCNKSKDVLTYCLNQLNMKLNFNLLQMFQLFSLSETVATGKCGLQHTVIALHALYIS